MANYIIQQKDIDILFQSNKQIFIKLELLNSNYKIIDSLEGNLINDSYSNDSQSDIRRTYSCTLHVSDSSFFIGSDKKIWIDRMVRPYIGIMHQRSQEIVWYKIGTFTINDTDYHYDASSKTLSLSLSDLMCTLNGDKGSISDDLKIVIESGNNIRNAIIETIKSAGITKYIITDIGRQVPYDLEFSTGATYYEILKELVELYAGYEMFFDLDGVFVVQPIPTLKDDMDILDDSIFKPLLISESVKNTFNKIYNVTQVWGKTIETDHYTQDCTSSNQVNYNVTIDGVTELENYAKYGIRIPVINRTNPTININNLGNIPIVEDFQTMDADNNPIYQNINPSRLRTYVDYVFKYRKATNDFLLLGQYQAFGEYKEYAEDCPFSIPNLNYKEIRQVMPIDNLESDSLCEQRAKYETWLSTRMLDGVSLSLVTIPFLDVNWKVSYTSKNNNLTNSYIIKSINGSNSDFTMNVEMIKFSPLYPDIIPNSKN